MKTLFAWLLCLLVCTTSVIAETLELLVLDPLSKDLACACVKGYAQRNYKVLAAHLQTHTGLEVRVFHGETLADALQKSGGSAHLVIGKHSVIQSEALKNNLPLKPIARLTGKDGSPFQKGLVVVRSDSPARQLSDLKGYRFYFGPENCEEKSEAPKRLLRSAGITPSTDSQVSDSCSTAAEALLKLDPQTRAAAVISSYAEPLLSGCGTIKPGDLRVIARTEEVPFVTAFLHSGLSATTAQTIEQALLSADADPKLLEALESLFGFIELEPQVPSQPHTPPDSNAPAPKPSASKDWHQFRGPSRNGTVDWLPKTLPTTPRFLWSVELPSDGMGGIAATQEVVLVGGRNGRDSADVFFCSMPTPARSAGVLSIQP